MSPTLKENVQGPRAQGMRTPEAVWLPGGQAPGRPETVLLEDPADPGSGGQKRTGLQPQAFVGVRGAPGPPGQGLWIPGRPP